METVAQNVACQRIYEEREHSRIYNAKMRDETLRQWLCRFELDEAAFVERTHPRSHLTWTPCRMSASGPLTPARRLDFAYGAAHNRESQDAAATDRVPNALAEQESHAFPLRTQGTMKAGDACARDDWT